MLFSAFTIQSCSQHCSRYIHYVQVQLSVLLKPVSEVHVVGGLQDAQTGPGLVQRRDPGGRIQQLHVEVEQHEAEELFDLVDCEEPAGTLGHARTKRHVEVAQFPAPAAERGFLLTVLQEAVVLELLQGWRLPSSSSSSSSNTIVPFDAYQN